MKKIALLSLLALAGLSLASELRSFNTAEVVAFAPDLPPPDCAPNCSAR